jgi:hypothetical protein
VRYRSFSYVTHFSWSCSRRCWAGCLFVNRPLNIRHLNTRCSTVSDCEPCPPSNWCNAPNWCSRPVTWRWAERSSASWHRPVGIISAELTVANLTFSLYISLLNSSLFARSAHHRRSSSTASYGRAKQLRVIRGIVGKSTQTTQSSS